MANTTPRTIGGRYQPAMHITDPEEAQRYFDRLVADHMERLGVGREEAERIERLNLGYYAGYCDHETRLRVEKLFAWLHSSDVPSGG